VASTPLPEQSSSKAARILAAAGELLLGRGSKGVTIAEVAQKAHVGKGTVYLYWDTKEDLLLGLIARDFLAVADEVTAALAADPDLARPSRLGPRMLMIAAERPFVHALHNIDDGRLGALADDPRSTTLLDTLGPSAMVRQVLPIWRRNHLASTAWTVADQAYALHALITGFITIAADRRARLHTDNPTHVLAAAVTALLGPEHASADQVKAAADDAIRLLADQHTAVLDIISPAAPPTFTP
jgi:AcrR family transcriptional regulator